MKESVPELKKGPFPQYPEGADMPGVVSANGRLALRRRFVRLPGGLKFSVRLPEYINRLSHESTIKLTSGNEADEATDTNVQVSLRPKALRREREELLEIIKETPKADLEKRKALIAKGHARDELAEEFISNQREVSVDMGELGKQMARFVVLTPPDREKAEAAKQKPPIFLISGISNDLESMGMLPQEIALNRNVITLAHPESWHGDVTDLFGKVAEQSDTFEPHVSFFKQMIENIRQMPDVKVRLDIFDQFELWGFSAGALIVSEMLTDKGFRQEISNAAIIAPASNFDRKSNIKLGLDIFADQFKTYATDFKNTAKMNPNFRGKIEYTDEYRSRQKRTFNAMAKKVLKKYPWWEQDMQVSEGGKIVVVAFANDEQAQTRRVESEIRQNLNLNLINLPGTHESPKIESERLINAVNDVLNN